MGSTSSKEPPVVPFETPRESPEDTQGITQESECPMKRSDGSYEMASWRTLLSSPHKQKPQEKTDGCPVKHSEYNVYSQPIDPSNNMPSVANQLPAPGQTKKLSTERVSSTIPKGGSDAGSTWTYPSPQMFYNALARKGKLTPANEEQEHMDSVVSLHNEMNEKTWKKVLQWEEVITGQPAKLLKFEGRPSDLSPKASFKHYVLGHPLPYDRHDWSVLRQDGSTVRYVMDYYYDDSALDGSSTLQVDVRPALDSVQAAWYRLAGMPYAHYNSTSPFEYLPLKPPASMKKQLEESREVWRSIQADVAASKGGAQDKPKAKPTKRQAKELADLYRQVDCNTQKAALDSCTDETLFAQVSLDWTLCMGKTLCPLQHKSLTRALQDDNGVDEALERLSQCVAQKNDQYVDAKATFPSTFR